MVIMMVMEIQSRIAILQTWDTQDNAVFCHVQVKPVYKLTLHFKARLNNIIIAIMVVNLVIRTNMTCKHNAVHEVTISH